jgi:hypothetical protein
MRWRNLLAVFYPARRELDQIEISMTESENKRLREALADARRKMMAETLERVKSDG